MKYLKLFTTHSDYDTVKSSLDKPNVSHCINENEVHYNPWVETRLIATFNITDTSSATSIIGSSATSQFSEIEIDDIVQPSVVNSYTFDTTGEHIVKYTLSDSTNIGSGAFLSCINLTSIIIPNCVTSISNTVFAGCTGLTSVTIPNSVTSIGNYVFQNCTNLTNVIIPDSVTSIGYGVFYNCRNLTSVTIPDGITSINNNTFSTCASLSSIIIPNSVISIGENAFGGCTSLTSITIPDNVTSINAYAFSFCSNLTSVISLATTAPTITNNTFQSVKTNGVLTVPIGSSGYDVWMGTGNYYLGKYSWTKVEQ